MRVTRPELPPHASYSASSDTSQHAALRRRVVVPLRVLVAVACWLLLAFALSSIAAAQANGEGNLGLTANDWSAHVGLFLRIVAFVVIVDALVIAKVISDRRRVAKNSASQDNLV